MTRHNGSIKRSSLDHRSAEVKEHERLSAVILDGIYQFVALLNPKGDYLEVNRTALEGAGHKIEEIRGKPFWTARWWQFSEQIKQDLQAAVRRGGAGEFVHYEADIFGDQSGRLPIRIDFSLQPIRGESGEVEYLLVEVRNITERKRVEEEVARQAQELRALNSYPTPLRDGEGRVVGGINVLLDVTERKRAEEALRHRSEQYETLLNQAPLGVYLVDADFLLIIGCVVERFEEEPGAAALGAELGIKRVVKLAAQHLFLLAFHQPS
jgi:PAS domain S-box-containing protein